MQENKNKMFGPSRELNPRLTEVRKNSRTQNARLTNTLNELSG